MNNKRAMSALLAILTLASVSCGSTGTAQETTAAGTNAATTDTNAVSAETERSEIKDALPKKDYAGKDFNILCRTEWAYEFDVTEQNGDIINDAIYKRNSAVEDRFNVKLKYTEIDGAWNSQSTFLNALNGSILAGDGAYDMVAGYQAYMITPAMEGYFLNILDMDNIDTTQPW